MKLKIRIITTGYFLVVFFGVLFSISKIDVFAIARGYMTSDTNLQTGMVVALSPDGSSSSSVERATQETSGRVVGIVTTINNSLISVSSEAAKVLVESDGQTDAYITDINGEVHKGDLLVLSPLKGILMRYSNDKTGVVIGIAADSPLPAVAYSYKDGLQSKNTQIAKLKVSLSRKGDNDTAVLPADSALKRLGRTLVGRNVDEIRVMLALILFIIVLIAEGGIIYGAVSSAFSALGRNPLAGTIIRSELIRVVLIALAVLLVGLGAVYALLWV